MIYAAVDLGTNAFRLLIVDKDKEEIIRRESEIIGLGAYINKDKLLFPPSKYYKVLDKFFKIIKELKVNRIDIVGTSIFRDCRNKVEIKKEFYSKYKYNLQIISPKKESQLTSYGALSPMKLKRKNYIVIDIGGGSTEISLVSNKVVQDYTSIKLGVVREFNKYKTTKNFSKNIKKSIFNNIKKKLVKNSFFSQLTCSDFTIIANGGTPTTLAAIKIKKKNYNRNLVNGKKLSLSYIKSIHELLMTMDPGERLKLNGMEKGREIVIIYGLFILLSILWVLKKRVLYVSDSGVLEGLVQESN